MIDSSLKEFSELLASKAPTPGGGGASAAVGALAAALGQMVCNLTLGKKTYTEYEEANRLTLDRLDQLRTALLEQIGADAEAFAPLAAAYGIPKDDPDRDAVMEAALTAAVVPPMTIMSLTAEVIDLLCGLELSGSRLALSDVGVAAAFAKAALEGAALNVFINTKAMKNRAAAEDINAQVKAYSYSLDTADACYRRIAEMLAPEV